MAQLFEIKKVTVGPKNLDAVVELAPNAPVMTNEDLEGTTRVWQVMPELRDHVCLGDESGNFGEVMGATELAHLLEHVTVELLARTDVAGDISCGQTSEVGEREYKLTFKCVDDVLVVGALSSAAWIMQWAFSGGGEPKPDVDAIASGLAALLQSLPEVEERDEDEIIGGPEPVAASEPEDEQVVAAEEAVSTEAAAEVAPAVETVPVAPVIEPAPVAPVAEPAPVVDESEVEAILAADPVMYEPAAEPVAEEAVPVEAYENASVEEVIEETAFAEVVEPEANDEVDAAEVAVEEEPQVAAAPEPVEENVAAAEPEPQPAVEAVAEQVVEPTPEPVAVPQPEPVNEPVVEAAPATVPEPVAEPEPEPAPVAVPASASEPTAAPVDDWGMENVPRPRLVR